MSWKKSLDEASRHQLTVARLNRAKAQYNSQRKTAAKRGIEWDFTFTTWIDWWTKNLGQNWQLKRGRKSTEYCMARIGDCGAYSTDNVECLLSKENCSSRKENGTAGDPLKKGKQGTDHPRARLTENQVLEIFSAEGTYKGIGARFGVTPGRVWSIKMKKTWKYLTKDLRDSEPR